VPHFLRGIFERLSKDPEKLAKKLDQAEAVAITKNLRSRFRNNKAWKPATIFRLLFDLDRLKRVQSELFGSLPLPVVMPSEDSDASGVAVAKLTRVIELLREPEALPPLSSAAEKATESPKPPIQTDDAGLKNQNPMALQAKPPGPLIGEQEKKPDVLMTKAMTLAVCAKRFGVHARHILKHLELINAKYIRLSRQAIVVAESDIPSK